MASSAAGPSASLAGDEGEPAWVQAFFAATPLESGMLDDVTHDCNRDDIPHGLQTGCEAFQRADRQHNTCGRCEKVDHDSPRVTCASCSQRGPHLCVSCANENWTILNYDWQCSACRVCQVCKERGDEITLRGCSQCNRAVHRKTCEGLFCYLYRHQKDSLPDGFCIGCAAAPADPLQPELSPIALDVMPTPEPTVPRRQRESAAFIARIKDKREAPLPILPFELQRLITFEAIASTLAVYEGADLASWRARQTFLKRACEVSTGWRHVAQPLLNRQPLFAFNWDPYKTDELENILTLPRQQWLRSFHPRPVTIDLGIICSAAGEPELPLRRYAGLILPALPSLPVTQLGARLLPPLTSLTLETGPSTWVAAIHYLIKFNLGGLERICLSVLDRLDATLGHLQLDLPHLVDLRLGTTAVDLAESEGLQVILASAASSLRILHLHTTGPVTMDPQLFDGLEQLEELSISSWQLARLFEDGRLPNLQRLFVGQPHIKMDELLWPQDDEALKSVQKLVVTAGRAILVHRRGLRLGVWDLDFAGTHRTSPIVRAISHFVQSKALILMDRDGRQFDAKWARKPVFRPTFGSGWDARRAKKGRKGQARRRASERL